jgi:ketosteroid isomerase-like protein
MTELEKAAAILGCQQAILRFFLALDGSDFATVAAGMAPDGVWHRQGQALVGPAAVRAALAERPPGRVTAHLVQNLVVDLEGGDAAAARYLSLVYRHDGAAGAAGPAPLDAPLGISLYTDRLCRRSGDWLVVERRSRRLFEKVS